MKNNTVIFAWLGVVLIIAVFYNFDAIARYVTPDPEKYCAEMQDGQLVVTRDGMTLTAEVTLENGTRIRPDATVIQKDGSTFKLQEEQCILDDGNVVGDGKVAQPQEEYAPPVKPN